MESSLCIPYTNTKVALTNLEHLLKCTVCKMSAASPVTLGGCEHIFCSVCCESYLGGSCPVCDLPAHVKDAEVDRQLFNMATLCGRLREILDDVNSNNQDPAVESIYCTPQQEFTHVMDKGSQLKQHVKDKDIIITKNSKSVASSLKSERNTSRKSKSRSEKSNKQENEQEDFKSEDTEVEVKSEEEVKVKSSALRNKKSKVESKPTALKDEENEQEQYRSEDLEVKLKSSTLRNKKSSKPTALKDDAPHQGNNNKKDKSSKQKESEKNAKEGGIKLTKTGKSIRTRKQGFSTNKEVTSYPEQTESEGTIDIDASKMTKRRAGSKRKSIEMNEKNGSVDGEQTNGKENNDEKGGKKTAKSKAAKSQDDSLQSEEERSSKKAECRKKLKKSGKAGVNDSILNDETGPDTYSGKGKTKIVPTSPSTGRAKVKETAHAPKQTDRNKTMGSPGLNKKNAKGETLLHVAAIKNEVSRVLQLLEGGANPNVRDNAGWTPLHEACNHGYTEVARLLLDHGAMMNVPGFENDSPLHDAVSNNRPDCVQLLVSRGASTTARNLHGLTPLDYAKTDEMKKALKTKVSEKTHTQKEVIDVLEYQQPCIVGTGLSREEKTILKKTTSQLKVKLADEVTPETTHIVTTCNKDGMGPRTVKIVQGILSGKWILNFEWLMLCREMKSLVCEEALEVQGLSMFPHCKSPFKGRMNRKQQLPGLFDGCWFYFNGDFEYSIPSKDDLMETLKIGGGKFLTREPKPGHLDGSMLTVPYHADPHSDINDCCMFVVFETGSKLQPIRSKYVCSVPASWIIDCAATFTLLPLPDT